MNMVYTEIKSEIYRSYRIDRRIAYESNEDMIDEHLASGEINDEEAEFLRWVNKELDKRVRG